MTIRNSVQGELSRWPTAENGECKYVLEEDGEMVGYVALSRIMTPGGEQCWIHDVAHWSGDPKGLVLLALKTRSQVREWGFSQVRTNVTPDSEILPMWLSLGFEVEQYLLVGPVN